MAVNIEVVKQQVEFVKAQLLGKKMRGDCSGIVVADYTKEEYAKILPSENWEDYVESQFLFLHYLAEAGISQDIHLQHIDLEGLEAFCKETGSRNDAAGRAYYAAAKFQKGGK